MDQVLGMAMSANKHKKIRAAQCYNAKMQNYQDCIMMQISLH